MGLSDQASMYGRGKYSGCKEQALYRLSRSVLDGGTCLHIRWSVRKKLLKIKFHSVARALVLHAENPQFGPQQHVSCARTSLQWSQFSGVEGRKITSLRSAWGAWDLSLKVQSNKAGKGMEVWLELSLGFLWDFHLFLKRKAVLGHIWMSLCLQERATVGSQSGISLSERHLDWRSYHGSKD